MQLGGDYYDLQHPDSHDPLQPPPIPQAQQYSSGTFAHDPRLYTFPLPYARHGASYHNSSQGRGEEEGEEEEEEDEEEEEEEEEGEVGEGEGEGEGSGAVQERRVVGPGRKSRKRGRPSEPQPGACLPLDRGTCFFWPAQSSDSDSDWSTYRLLWPHICAPTHARCAL